MQWVHLYPCVSKIYWKPYDVPAFSIIVKGIKKAQDVEKGDKNKKNPIQTGHEFQLLITEK